MEVIVFGIAYAVFSSTLIVVNKWALSALPTPNFLLVLQSLATAVLVYGVARFGGKSVGMVPQSTFKWFATCVVIQFLTILSNMFSLHHLGVDRVILLRIVAMIPISIGDYIFNNRMIPSLQSWICFSCLCLANLFVFSTDTHGITLTGVIAGAMYFIFISADQVLLKTFTRVVEMPDSDRTIWVNLFSVPLSLAGIISTGESGRIFNHTTPFFSSKILVPFLISCILGAGISYTAWGLRSRSSAVTFSLIGIVCKIGSMALNFLFFDHLSLMSLVLISLGIASTFYYEQAPLRADPNDVEVVAASPDSKPSNPIKPAANPKILQVSLVCLAILILGIGQAMSNNAAGEKPKVVVQPPVPYVSIPIPPYSKDPRGPNDLPNWLKQGSYSMHRCIGGVPEREDAWRFRSCYFRNVCYNGNANGTLLYFADPTSMVQPEELTTATGPLFDHPASNPLPSKYGPEVVKSSIQEFGKGKAEWQNRGYRHKVLTVVASWFIPGQWSHLLFDNIYPIYRLMSYFGLEDATVQALYSLDMCSSCDFKPTVEWQALVNGGGDFKPEKLQDYFKTKFQAKTVGSLNADNLMCFDHLITGLGILTDHGLGVSGHGRSVKDPDWPLWGSGNTLWDFRLWTMQRAGISNPTSIVPKRGEHDVALVRKGKRGYNFVVDMDPFEKAIQEKMKQSGLDSFYNYETPKLETMSVAEQMQRMSTTKVLVSQTGSTSFAGFWLPPGATLILVRWNYGDQEYLDYPMWNNIPWITVKYFKTTQVQEIADAVVDALSRYERESVATSTNNNSMPPQGYA